MELPKIPASLNEFVPYIAKKGQDIQSAMQPYRQYETKLREAYAQDRGNPILEDSCVNAVPLFGKYEDQVTIRARDLEREPDELKEKYLLPLTDELRKPDGAPAIVQSLRDFRSNFNVFSESSLADLDWSNVIAAGSSAVTALLPVPAQYNKSKRDLREYYHEKLAPASDVDLFIYGLNEEQGKKKIEQIERCIRDSILYETTTIRTKYAVTIASQYPCRHVQIVLRLYKSLSEVLTGFDVDSACVAYDGRQVYATPRAVAALMTQINTVDLSRRSPSYENRLSKYARRGFEVFCPTLDRSRVDPTIFERSFGRVLGLARLLVLEKLPSPTDRDNYLAKRREERGRPELGWQACQHGLPGNIKEKQPDDVAEWIEADEVSNYHTFTVPYGPKFHAKKIEKLLFTKDLLLNAEWNSPKDRTVRLHRHPAFFGTAQDIFGDCCGFCPDPQDEEEELVAEKEAEVYIRGGIKFIEDNSGRQQIGSFNPLTEDDWTEMAYVGNTARLCQAIVDGDVDHVRDWCQQEGVDVNRRDRTGRTPLHLAAMCSTVEVVQCLIDNGARLVARLVDGTTALHIAARRGEAEMVRAILKKSEENEGAEEDRHQKRIEEVRAKRQATQPAIADQYNGKDRDTADDAGSSAEELEHDESLGEQDSDDEMTQGSFVRVKDKAPPTDPEEANPDDPDVYDPNVLAWDYPVSPLHLAAMNGHVGVIEAIVGTYGADALLPVKIKDTYNDQPKAAAMTLVLAAMFAPDGPATARQLLKNGASSAQADMKGTTALHFIVHEGNTSVLDMLFEYDAAAATAAVDHISMHGWEWSPQARTPLLSALHKRDEQLAFKLLDRGAMAHITFSVFKQSYQREFENIKDSDEIEKRYIQYMAQPIQVAVQNDLPLIGKRFLKMGVDVNTLSSDALLTLPKAREWNMREADRDGVQTVLDMVRERQKSLKEAMSTEEPAKPETLREDSYYVRGLKAGTYAHWMATGDLDRAKDIVKYLNKQRQDEMTKLYDGEPGSSQKRKAMQETLEAFENLAKSLVAAGAKPFNNLHPDIELPKAKEKYTRPTWGVSYYSGKKFDKSYDTDYGLVHADMTDGKAEGYMALFEAAWSGDTATVKALTLAPWRFDMVGAASQENKEEAPPLQVAVQDSAGFSPYALAVLRGHLDLARDIVEIATVQYKPNKNEAKYRYRVGERERDEDDFDYQEEDKRSDEIPVTSDLIDDKYTVDDITALAEITESRVSPLTMINWTCQIYRMLGSMEEGRKLTLLGPPDWDLRSSDIGCKTKYGPGHVVNLMTVRRDRERNNLFEYAVLRDDLPLFRFLLEQGVDLTQREEDPESDGPRIFEPDGHLFYFAIRRGRPEMVGELLKVNGNRLPLQQMVKKLGVEVKERPKYYQGLTVYGKKRKDWADRSRGIMSSQTIETETPPLLLAATENRVDMTEYFIGSAPLRRYEEFIEAHSDHKAIQALNERPGGIKKALSTWMRSRRELAIHATVLGERGQKADQIRQLRWLLDIMPESVDAPNCDRITPLHAAFRASRFDAARLLIERGANQVTRDRRAENVLHHLVSAPRHNPGEAEPLAARFRALLGLLDPTLLAELLLQRSAAEAGAYTPLSKLLHRGDVVKPDPDAVRVLLEFSGGKDLTLMDGAGDLPLHYVARRGWTALTKLFLEHDPSLLRRENATGVTPAELLANVALRHFVDNPPQLPHSYGSDWWRQILPDVPVERFDPERKKNEREEDSLANAGRVCREAMDAHPGKRRLVSLFDANEVALRISSLQKEQGANGRRTFAVYDDNQNTEAEQKDEVEDWMGRAGCHVPYKRFY